MVVTATRTETRADALVSDVRVIDRARHRGRAGAHAARSCCAQRRRADQRQRRPRQDVAACSSAAPRTATPSCWSTACADGSATAGTPAWEHLPVEMIERIEVLKGPAPALYGSEGVGGVVQVFTRKGRAGFHPTRTLHGGGSPRPGASARLPGGQGARRATRLRARSDCATAASPRPTTRAVRQLQPRPRRLPPQRPRRWQRARPRATAMTLGLRWRDGARHPPSTTPVGPATTGRRIATRRARRAALAGRLRLSGMAGPSAAQTSAARRHRHRQRRRAVPLPATSSTDGRADRPAEWHAGRRPRARRRWSAREQKRRGSHRRTPSPRARINAAFAGLNGRSRQPTAGRPTCGATATRSSAAATPASPATAIASPPAWRVHASHGTSFVAPSFNQLYFPGFGNAALQPRAPARPDLGADRARHGRARGASWCASTTASAASSTRPTLRRTTSPHARIDGWTLGYDGRLGSAGGARPIDRLDPRNEVTGRQLPRRAHDAGAAGRRLATAARWHFGGIAAVRWASASTTRPTRCRWPATPRWTCMPTGSSRRDWALQAKREQPDRPRLRDGAATTSRAAAFYVTLRWQPK